MMNRILTPYSILIAGVLPLALFAVSSWPAYWFAPNTLTAGLPTHNPDLERAVARVRQQREPLAKDHDAAGFLAGWLWSGKAAEPREEASNTDLRGAKGRLREVEQLRQFAQAFNAIRPNGDQGERDQLQKLLNEYRPKLEGRGEPAGGLLGAIRKLFEDKDTKVRSREEHEKAIHKHEELFKIAEWELLQDAEGFLRRLEDIRKLKLSGEYERKVNVLMLRAQFKIEYDKLDRRLRDEHDLEKVRLDEFLSSFGGREHSGFWSEDENKKLERFRQLSTVRQQLIDCCDRIRTRTDSVDGLVKELQSLNGRQPADVVKRRLSSETENWLKSRLSDKEWKLPAEWGNDIKQAPLKGGQSLLVGRIDDVPGTTSWYSYYDDPGKKHPDPGSRRAYIEDGGRTYGDSYIISSRPERWHVYGWVVQFNDCLSKVNLDISNYDQWVRLKSKCDEIAKKVSGHRHDNKRLKIDYDFRRLTQVCQDVLNHWDVLKLYLARELRTGPR